GGVSARNIARWDGAAWHPLATSMSQGAGAGEVRCVLVVPPGSGALSGHLVIAGGFTSVDGVSADNIAHWDGSTWAPLSSGLNNYDDALAMWDPDGAGPAAPQLVAGGSFTTAGGVTAPNVA